MNCSKSHNRTSVWKKRQLCQADKLRLFQPPYPKICLIGIRKRVKDLPQSELNKEIQHSQIEARMQMRLTVRNINDLSVRVLQFHVGLGDEFVIFAEPVAPLGLRHARPCGDCGWHRRVVVNEIDEEWRDGKARKKEKEGNSNDEESMKARRCSSLSSSLPLYPLPLSFLQTMQE